MFRNALIVIWALIGGFGVFSVPLAAHSSDCQDTFSSDRELRQLLDAFLVGASINDGDVHDRFWDEDLVYTSSGGERFGKRAIMDGLSEPDAGNSKPLRYSATDVSIRAYGETAVITFRLLAEQEESLVGEYFNTGVFRCSEKAWRAVAWQATRVKSQ